MMEKVSEFCAEYDMLPRSGLVLAGVSGGADSMCLLHVLLDMAKTGGFTVAAAHFNHRLRGAESDGDEEFVRRHCETLGVRFVAGSGDVNAYAAEHGLGTEEAAREMRYAFFYSAAENLGAARIATAHTADDNAETLLLNLARGTGLKGLCGIPPARGIIIRPLLTVTRAEVEEYLRENAIPHREDSTNALDDYARNRVRHRVIPVLKEINPALCASVSAAAELLRADEGYLSSLAEDFIEKNVKDGRAPAAELAALPVPIGSRVVRALLGGGLSSGHVRAVLALASSDDPSASLSLPGTTVRREYKDVVFGDENPLSFAPAELAPGGKAEIKEAGLRFLCENTVNDGSINKTFTTFLFKTDSICGNITIRPRVGGDSIRLSAGGGAKSLKKLFIEKKIPALRRNAVPVIADDRGPVAVFGMGQDIKTFPAPGDAVLKVTVEEIKRTDVQ